MTKLTGKPLAEVAAIVEAQLARHGFESVLVGGSAITCYASSVYTSEDIDLAVPSGLNRRALTEALAEIGFVAVGRDFAHPDTPYTIDFVADTPYVDQRPLTAFVLIETHSGPVRVISLEDALADRIAAFVYWNDSESLDVAKRALLETVTQIDRARLDAALLALPTEGAASAARRAFAHARINEAYALLESRGGGKSEPT